MKTIVTGSQTITNYDLVKELIDRSDIKITEIISGESEGVDELAIRYAKENNIPHRVFKTNLNKYGKSASKIRNREMAKHADALIAIWDGKSRGTKNMIEVARDLGLELIVIYTIEEEEK